MPEPVELKLSSESIVINPGEQVGLDISVKNISKIVDVFEIQVVGLTSSWHKLSVESLSLFPEQSGNSRITISVPKKSDATAQTYPFKVKVSSRKNPHEMNGMDCALEVLPYYDFDASISPQRVSGAVGRYTVTLDNKGNSDVNCFLEGSDPENLCLFSFESSGEPARSPIIPPGSKTSVNVIVEPNQRPLRPPSRNYNLNLVVKPRQDALSSVPLNVTFEATPRLPGWAIPAAIVAAVVLVGIIAAAVILTRGPSPIETHFLLAAGQEQTFAFQLPNAEPMRLELAAEWEGDADAINVRIERPDTVQLAPATLTRSDPKARFDLSQSDVGQGMLGWKISIENTHDTGQADGVLTVSSNSLN